MRKAVADRRTTGVRAVLSMCAKPTAGASAAVKRAHRILLAMKRHPYVGPSPLGRPGPHQAIELRQCSTQSKGKRAIVFSQKNF